MESGSNLVAQVLREIPLLSGLPDDERARLEGRVQIREYPPQTVIVREGSAGDAMFIIVSGTVAVRRKDPDSGVEFLLSELGPGQMFGEIALLTGRTRTATVVAAAPTVCAVLDYVSFVELIETQPQIALRMMAVLSERVEQANRHIGIDFVNLARVQIDPRVLKVLPHALLTEHKVVPVAFCNNRLTLAMTNPNDIVAFDDIRRVLKGVMIEPAAISDDDFRRFMATTYAQLLAKSDHDAARPTVPKRSEPDPRAPSAPGGIDLLQSDLIRELQLADDTQATSSETKQDLMIASEDAPIVRLANSILGLAIKQGASDIHVEPMEQDVTVRFRIDGALQVVQRLPRKVQLGLISRIKILARLDIAEKRLPQDGRISVTMDGKPIDFRVSTVPGKWGEKAVLRLLDKSNTRLGLDKLITHHPTLEKVREMIRQPYGIVYVTGPTGSGKTTTLYSALVEINDPARNISTAEDPIEYDLNGVTQIQVNKDIGLDFATVLRAFLRQDPDVMLVGETRDRETAHTAVEAALTGHLVFTTLHTNSAAASFTRLAEMGIEAFLVSSSTIGVIAQRLARRLCRSCRERYEAEPGLCAYLGVPPGTPLSRGRGCDQCVGKGVRGRIGIYEVLRMNTDLRTMVARGSRAEEIHAAAVANGMIDLKGYAALLLAAGEVSAEEVMRVISVTD